MQTTATTRALLLVLVALEIAACDQDPMHLSERTISGAYRLSRWEDGTTYYLVTPATRDSSGGAIGGAVLAIAWSGSYIGVKRQPLTGTSPDWVLIDTRQSRIVLTTPDSTKVIAGIQAPAPTVKTATQAWESLR